MSFYFWHTKTQTEVYILYGCQETCYKRAKVKRKWKDKLFVIYMALYISCTDNNGLVHRRSLRTCCLETQNHRFFTDLNRPLFIPAEDKIQSGRVLQSRLPEYTFSEGSNIREKCLSFYYRHQSLPCCASEGCPRDWIKSFVCLLHIPRRVLVTHS
jgi:hypothetical protein